MRAVQVAARRTDMAHSGTSGTGLIELTEPLRVDVRHLCIRTFEQQLSDKEP